MNATGGAITLDDLAGYQARWEEPLRTTYRDVEIASPPPPSNGGLFISMVMNMAEQFGLEKMPHYTESARTLVLLRRIFSAAETNVIEYVHDPLSANVPIDTLLSKDYAKMLARLIDGSWPTAATGAAPLAPAQMSPFVGDATVHDPLYSDTNHLVIADAMGNWVSVTHTIYGSTFATGLVVDGVVANSGNSFPGTASGKGRRVVSPFPATMVMRAGTASARQTTASNTTIRVLISLLLLADACRPAILRPRWLSARFLRCCDDVTHRWRIPDQRHRAVRLVAPLTSAPPQGCAA